MLRYEGLRRNWSADRSAFFAIWSHGQSALRRSITLPPDATSISVREVLAKFDTEFASVAQAAENGEFAFWVGSGISRQAPDLGNLIERAFDY